MKICQIIPHLGSGGAERFVVDLSNELVEMGHEVSLLTFYELNDKYGFYLNELDSRVKICSIKKNVGFSLKVMWQVFSLIIREKPDIVHSHINSLQYTVIPQIFLSKGVHTVHSEAHLEASGRFEINLRKFVFKFNLVKPVTISVESQKSFINFYGKTAPLINNGRAVKGEIMVSDDVREEMDTYRKSNKTKLIVQLARFQPPKNIPMMARVAARLFKEGYDFTLLFIGSTENTSIVNEVKSLMPPCAYILGERKNPLEYLKESDAFALSSSFEGMPISLLEALAVGAVPVCTPVGGIPNVVCDGVNGFLSKSENENDYYDAMKCFLQASEADLTHMREKAIDSFGPYSMRTCAAKYAALYSNLLKNKKFHEQI